MKTLIAASAPKLGKPSLQHPRTSSQPKRSLRRPRLGAPRAGCDGRRAAGGHLRGNEAMDGRERHSRGGGEGEGFNSLTAGRRARLALQQSRAPTSAELGRIKEEAGRSGPRLRLAGKLPVTSRLDLPAFPAGRTRPLPGPQPWRSRRRFFGSSFLKFA